MRVHLSWQFHLPSIFSVEPHHSLRLDWDLEDESGSNRYALIGAAFFWEKLGTKQRPPPFFSTLAMAQEQRPTPSFTLIIDSDTNELIPEEELPKRRAWTEEARRSNLALSYTDPITDTKVTQEEWIRREQVRVQYDINPRHCIDEEAIAELKASLSRQEWLKASPKRRSTAGTLDPAVGVAVGLPGSVGPQLNTLAVKSNVGKGKWNLAYSPLVPERLSEETSPFYSCTAFIVRHRRVSTSELFTAYQQFTDLAQQLSQLTSDVTVDLSVLSALVEQVITEFNVVSSQSINIREEADLAKEGFLSALVDRYGWDRDIGEFVNTDISSLSEDITQTLIRAREIFEDNLDDNNELSYGDNGEMFYSKSGKQTESLTLFDDSIDSPSLVSAVIWNAQSSRRSRIWQYRMARIGLGNHHRHRHRRHQRMGEGAILLCQRLLTTCSMERSSRMITQYSGLG